MDQDITVTPEMVIAGRAKWVRWKNSSNPSTEVMLKMIYRAMRRLEPTWQPIETAPKEPPR